MSMPIINHTNYYHINRKAIYELWEKAPYLTTSDACMAYRKSQGVGDPDGKPDGIDEAITEFSNYVTALGRAGGDVEAYFLG